MVIIYFLGSVLQVTRLLELDVSNLVFHPACVISALLTSLCTETGIVIVVSVKYTLI